MKNHILKKSIISAIVTVAMSSSAYSISIAMNFAENETNQNFAGGNLIGPTAIDSSNWNNSINRDSGSLATGALNTLVQSDGSATGATLTWSSNNVFFNGDGIGSDEARLAVGYLDDSTGASFTLSNITYSKYSVYVLFTSDNNGNYQHGAITVDGTGVNGGGDFNAYGRVTDGTGWLEADGTVFGNYVKVDDVTTSTLTVNSIRNGAARGPITGFIIEDTTVPEPSSTALLGLGTLGLALRRRR